VFCLDAGPECHGPRWRDKSSWEDPSSEEGRLGFRRAAPRRALGLADQGRVRRRGQGHAATGARRLRRRRALGPRVRGANTLPAAEALLNARPAPAPSYSLQWSTPLSGATQQGSTPQARRLPWEGYQNNSQGSGVRDRDGSPSVGECGTAYPFRHPARSSSDVLGAMAGSEAPHCRAKQRSETSGCDRGFFEDLATVSRGLSGRSAEGRRSERPAQRLEVLRRGGAWSPEVEEDRDRAAAALMWISRPPAARAASITTFDMVDAPG
jgi:hypothetical protein